MDGVSLYYGLYKRMISHLFSIFKILPLFVDKEN